MGRCALKNDEYLDALRLLTYYIIAATVRLGMQLPEFNGIKDDIRQVHTLMIKVYRSDRAGTKLAFGKTDGNRYRSEYGRSARTDGFQKNTMIIEGMQVPFIYTVGALEKVGTKKRHGNNNNTTARRRGPQSRTQSVPAGAEEKVSLYGINFGIHAWENLVAIVAVRRSSDPYQVFGLDGLGVVPEIAHLWSMLNVREQQHVMEAAEVAHSARCSPDRYIVPYNDVASVTGSVPPRGNAMPCDSIATVHPGGPRGPPPPSPALVTAATAAADSEPLTIHQPTSIPSSTSTTSSKRSRDEMESPFECDDVSSTFSELLDMFEDVDETEDAVHCNKKGRIEEPKDEVDVGGNGDDHGNHSPQFEGPDMFGLANLLEEKDWQFKGEEDAPPPLKTDVPFDFAGMDSDQLLEDLDIDFLNFLW